MHVVTRIALSETRRTAGRLWIHVKDVAQSGQVQEEYNSRKKHGVGTQSTFHRTDWYSSSKLEQHEGEESAQPQPPPPPPQGKLAAAWEHGRGAQGRMAAPRGGQPPVATLDKETITER